MPLNPRPPAPCVGSGKFVRPCARMHSESRTAPGAWAEAAVVGCEDPHAAIVRVMLAAASAARVWRARVVFGMRRVLRSLG